MAADLFKKRYYNHQTSFRYPDKRSATILAGHIWDLKDRGTTYAIRWSIIARARPYRNGSKICRLCTAEIICILASLMGPNKSQCFNSRSEILGKCPHADRFVLHAWGASHPPD